MINKKTLTTLVLFINSVFAIDSPRTKNQTKIQSPSTDSNRSSLDFNFVTIEDYKEYYKSFNEMQENFSSTTPKLIELEQQIIRLVEFKIKSVELLQEKKQDFIKAKNEFEKLKGQYEKSKNIDLKKLVKKAEDKFMFLLSCYLFAEKEDLKLVSDFIKLRTEYDIEKQECMNEEVRNR